LSDHFEVFGDEELNAIVDSSDPFVVCVKGHQAVEELLDLVLSESLHDPHALEIRQLGFGLKVDLALALGVIADRPVFVGLNRFRNRFAHDRTAELSNQDAVDFFNSWPERLRTIAERTEVASDTNPLDIIADAVLILAVLLGRQITALRDAKAQQAITGELLRHLREGKSLTDLTRGKSAVQHAEDRLNELRAERQARGLL
jgi:hypothetical protein